MKAKLEKGLKNVNGNPITDLNSNWESAPISFSAFRHLGIQLGWDNATVTGTLRLQYSCDPSGDGSDVSIWTDKNVLSLDGTFDEAMFLDANLPVGNVRLTFAHASGTANLVSYIVKKE